MAYRESFGRTVNSFIQNFSPWGTYAVFPVTFCAYWLVGRIWPDLSAAMTAFVMVPVAVAIFMVGFVGLASAVAILKSSNESSE